MESPEFVSLVGNGKFFFDDSVVESSFVLSRNPYWIGIIMKEGFSYVAAIKLISERIPVQLSGVMNDGRPIKAAALYLTNTQATGNLPGVEFTALEGVALGQPGDTHPPESRYPLTGCFDGNISLVHDGWEIKTIPCPSPNAAQALAKKWHIPVEGMVLQLRREGLPMVQHQDFARVVMTLLSLASGTGVSCDRHFFTWAKEELEIWRHGTGDEIGPGAIVPAFELVKFLEQTLSTWQSLSQDQWNALRLAIDYINLSARGYLDTRLFHIFQPWEFLIKAWGIKGVLSESEACLRSRLLQTRKQWNQDHSNCDVTGFWGGRISLIFDWPKLKDAIIHFAISFGLDLKRIGLDLDLLNDTRNNVAHSGKLSENLTDSNRQALGLLTTGQYCLQLLILRMLAYQGQVYHATGGWSSIVEIDQALTTGRT